jgi:hypothetical protein
LVAVTGCGLLDGRFEFDLDGGGFGFGFAGWLMFGGGG